MSSSTIQHASPKQVAKAIGVSESSLKRWCDKGILPVVVTPGGHRKIPMHAVVSFIRESKQPLVDPSVLGLPSATKPSHASLESAVPLLRRAALEGAEEQTRRILLDVFFADSSVEAICDQLIVPVFREIGHSWEVGTANEYQERRACQLVLLGLRVIRDLLPPPRDDAPLAIGGTPSGDVYDLPTNLVELCLRAHGWRATSLGTNLPFSSYTKAVRDVRPTWFWLSVSHMAQPEDFVRDYQLFYQEVNSLTKVVLGGRDIPAQLAVALPCDHFCDSMTSLVSAVGNP